MDSDRYKAYKLVAYSAIGFSVVAVVSVCITLPIVYNYVQTVMQHTRTEVKLCKVSESAFPSLMA